MDTLDKYKTEQTIQNFRDSSIIHSVDFHFLENIKEYDEASPSLGRGYAFISKDDQILDVEHVVKESKKNYEVVSISGGHSVPLKSIGDLSERINFLKMQEVM